MDASFESYTDDGSLQLSIGAQPYTLRKSFRINKRDMDTYKRSAFQSFKGKSYDISYMTNPIVALRVENSNSYGSTAAALYGSSARVQTSGSSKTLVISGGLVSDRSDQMQSVLQVYIFDTWSPPERASGSVFRLFRDNGSLIYDSAWNYLRLTQTTIPNSGNARCRMFEDVNLGTYFSSGTGDFNYAVAIGSPKASRLDTGRMLYDGVLTLNGGFHVIGCILETDSTSSMAHAGATTGDYTKALIVRTSGLPNTYG